MNGSSWLRALLASVRPRGHRAEELERELEAHLELEKMEQQESGLSPEDAHYAARRAFGSTTRVQEDLRAIWNLVWMERLARDAKYAAQKSRVHGRCRPYARLGHRRQYRDFQRH